MTWTIRPRSDIGGHPSIVSGEGEPVLLLHGVGLRAEAWGAQIDGLSQQALIVAPDMAGHGEYPLPSSRMVLADYVRAAGTVLNGLGGKAIVVGHSMGAMISLALAAQFPDRVKAVVALNAVFERSHTAAAAVLSRAEELDGRTPADIVSPLQRWFGDSDTPERVACRQWLGSMDPAAYKLAYTAFAHSQTPSRDLLASLQCLAIFMTGAQEPNSTPEMSHAMANVAPDGRAIVVEGAAHMMPMTHSKQVNAVLSNLIGRCKT